MKIYSFTANPDRGWTAVTPLGLIIVEQGMQVTIAVSETWEEGADAIRAVREQTRDIASNGEDLHLLRNVGASESEPTK